MQAGLQVRALPRKRQRSRVRLPPGREAGSSENVSPLLVIAFCLEHKMDTKMNYNQEAVPGGVPIKMWTQGVPVEDDAKRQLSNAAKLPIVFKHIAAMPDVHLGIGATVGSVIPTLKA